MPPPWSSASSHRPAPQSRRANGFTVFQVCSNPMASHKVNGCCPSCCTSAPLMAVVTAGDDGQHDHFSETASRETRGPSVLAAGTAVRCCLGGGAAASPHLLDAFDFSLFLRRLMIAGSAGHRCRGAACARRLRDLAAGLRRGTRRCCASGSLTNYESAQRGREEGN